MKVKRFNNLWTMGLIIFGALLVGFYVLKIVCPKFIVGVAEIPSIVNFGSYVDSHLWAYYLFNGITSYLIGYVYCCACCRVKSLKIFDCFILLLLVAIPFALPFVLPILSLVYNNILYILAPLVMSARSKSNTKNIFYSTTISFVVTSLAQVASLEIRGISTIISYPNTATYFVLLIDLYIWNFLLYFYFNWKGDNKNG
jgi:hypothetical protein